MESVPDGGRLIQSWPFPLCTFWVDFFILFWRRNPTFEINFSPKIKDHGENWYTKDNIYKGCINSFWAQRGASPLFWIFFVRLNLWICRSPFFVLTFHRASSRRHIYTIRSPLHAIRSPEPPSKLGGHSQFGIFFATRLAVWPNPVPQHRNATPREGPSANVRAVAGPASDATRHTCGGHGHRGRKGSAGGPWRSTGAPACLAASKPGPT